MHFCQGPDIHGKGRCEPKAMGQGLVSEQGKGPTANFLGLQGRQLGAPRPGRGRDLREGSPGRADASGEGVDSGVIEASCGRSYAPGSARGVPGMDGVLPRTAPSSTSRSCKGRGLTNRMIQRNRASATPTGGRIAQQGMPSSGMLAFNPIMTNFLSRNAIPIFTGEDTDFEGWSREFQGRVSMLRKMGGEVEFIESVLIRELKEALDKGGQDLLDRRLQENPSLTFEEFWVELEKIYARDMAKIRRKKFEEVSLGTERFPTLRQWRMYENAFELNLRMVTDMSDVEIQKKLLCDIPPSLKERVRDEMMRRGRENFWVKVSKPCPLPTEELVGALGTMMGIANPRVEENEKEILIDCGSERGQDLACSAQGWMEEGSTLRIQRTTKHMGWRDILSFVGEDIRVSEDVNAFIPPTSHSRVHAVETASRPLTPLQPQDKGQGVERPVMGEQRAQHAPGWQERGRSKGKGKPWGKGRQRSGSSSSANAVPEPFRGGKGTTQAMLDQKAPSHEVVSAGLKPPPIASSSNAPHANPQAPLLGKYRCTVCKWAGRAFDHYYFDCEHWRASQKKKIEKEAQKGGGKGGSQDKPYGKGQKGGDSQQEAPPNP